MLLNDFFTIKTMKRQDAPNEETCGETDGKTFRVALELNVRHRIFGGHFPGQPVVPGACLLQMVKEITQRALATEWDMVAEWATVRELRLSKADSLKFLAPIDPEKDNLLDMVLTVRIIEEEQVSVSASLLNNESVCFKFNGVFHPVKPV